MLNKHPIHTLCDTYRARFVDTIRAQFTDMARLMFIVQIYYVLNYTPTDFVIPITDVANWIGLGGISVVKKMLMKMFREDEDYGTKQFPSENAAEPNVLIDVIMLSLNTFKMLCLSAKTDQGSQCYRDLNRLESLYQKILKESIDARPVLTDIQKQYNFFKKTPMDVIYVFKHGDNYKIGKTANIHRRTGDYKTYNLDGNVVYIKHCYNHDLMEKLIHMILDRFRIDSRREWFNCSLEIIKSAIDTAHAFTDGAIHYADAFDKVDTLGMVVHMVNRMREVSDCSDIGLPKPDIPNFTNPFSSIAEKTKEAELKEIEAQYEHIKNTLPTRDISDYEQFIADSCEINPEYICIKAELDGAYKLWARTTEVTMNQAMVEYVTKKFKVAKRYIDAYDAVLAIYVGFRLLPLTLKLEKPDTPNEHEQFLLDCCKFGYVYRCPFDLIYKTYQSWKQKIIPEYVITHLEKIRLIKTIHQQFISHAVYVHTTAREYMGTSVYGVWGMTLKEDETHVGLKLAPKLQKRVFKLSSKTHQLIGTWPSVLATARANNVTASCISNYIKNKVIRKDAYYTFVPPPGYKAAQTSDAKPTTEKSAKK